MEYANTVKILQSQLNTANRMLEKQKLTIQNLRSLAIDKLTSASATCMSETCQSMINMLRDELKHLREMYIEKDIELQKTAQQLKKADHNYHFWQAQYDNLIEDQHEMSKQLVTIIKKKEIPVIDESPVIQISVKHPLLNGLQAKLEGDLKMQFHSLFVISPECDGNLDENTLYDSFMLDQPETERLNILSLMYSACHAGWELPDREKKMFKDNGTESKKKTIRICKHSFSACLKALGGISKVKNSNKLWNNIRLRHPPCFENK